MKNNQILTQALNDVLKDHLTAINQFFLHARLLKHQRFVHLADRAYRASIDQMKYADLLVEHILALGGLPNMQHLGEMTIGKQAQEILVNDLAYIKRADFSLLKAKQLADAEGNKEVASVLRAIADRSEEYRAFIESELAKLESEAC